ncbi:TVP38/TMEM64 family protein [Desulfuribacillus alkaliarsenatis]|uniref:TVP38/TMEM64 family membrane protein n=1 Tax=Desulfuribacillus alkaliarsenatis TaxID=766136 RepID=A0A1E5G3X8_9FIRM|nr:VTT domain-containing protein [Desulfuribacillus alkaliarsenatis]OEF97784.1 hypothetical protein BHF68_13930 [Desulfuribacillus alkaliarsenatis]
MKKTIISVLVAILIAISIFIEINTELLSQVWKGNFETLRILSSENLFLTFVLTLILMIVQNTFTVIPLILLITFNITLFGFVYGYLWSWFTSVIAAAIVFFAVRYFFQDYVLRKIQPGVKEKAEENGFMYVFIGRVFPFVPTSLINIAAGVFAIRFDHFLIATIFGNLIYFFVLSLIPLGILAADLDRYVLALLALAAVSVFLVRTYYKKKKAANGSEVEVN